MWFPVIWLLSSPLVLQQRLFSASLSCWSIISPTTSVGERVLICVGERAEETIVSLSLHGCESCCSITTKQKLLLLVFLPNSCRQISCRIFWPTETLLILFSIYNMYIKDKHLNILTWSIFTLRTSPHIRLVAQVVCEVVTLRAPIRWRQINLYVLYIITFQIHVRYLKSDHTCPVCLTQV